MGKTLSTEQAARRLGLCRKTVLRWIKARKFSEGSVVNLGSEEWPRYRIDRAEIERIEAQGAAPLPGAQTA